MSDPLDTVAPAGAVEGSQSLASVTAPAVPEGGGSFDWLLFAIFAGLLLVVAASNVWLRLRAEQRSLRDLLQSWFPRVRQRR